MTTQTTLLPATVGTDVSADLVLEAGTSAKVGMFQSDTTKLIKGIVSVQQKTPGGQYVPVSGGTLTAAQYAVMLQGPGTYRASRNIGTDIGVYSEQ